MAFSNNASIRSGYFTVDAEISSNYVIPHGLGVSPSFFVVANLSSSSNNLRRFVCRDTNGLSSFGVFGRNASSGNMNNLSENILSYAYADATNITLNPGTTPWGAGDYIWIAIK